MFHIQLCFRVFSFFTEPFTVGRLSQNQLPTRFKGGVGHDVVGCGVSSRCGGDWGVGWHIPPQLAAVPQTQPAFCVGV